jgi:hypothetical protein
MMVGSPQQETVTLEYEVTLKECANLVSHRKYEFQVFDYESRSELASTSFSTNT